MIPSGNRIEMMPDNYLLESLSGISFRLAVPQKGPEVYDFKAPRKERGSLIVELCEAHLYAMDSRMK